MPDQRPPVQVEAIAGQSISETRCHLNASRLLPVCLATLCLAFVTTHTLRPVGVESRGWRSLFLSRNYRGTSVLSRSQRTRENRPVVRLKSQHGAPPGTNEDARSETDFWWVDLLKHKETYPSVTKRFSKNGCECRFRGSRFPA